ncbi:MAG: PQQ-binding-like beta-propeller repeat protein [Actinomycetota bacterium]
MTTWPIAGTLVRVQERKRIPSWLLPTLFCLLALVGFVGLDRHFTAVTDGGREAGRAALAVGSQIASVALPGVGEDEPPDPSIVDEAAAVVEATFRPDTDVWVDPASSQRPWSDLGAVEGLLTFRGNPTRTYYGQGPVPAEPVVAWTYDIGCSVSPVGGEAKTWCGSGWTGQPAVYPSAVTGEWQVAFGAYNRAVNFLDPITGEEVLPKYFTDDIVKGSVTVDPDGFPLLYTGSRDNHFHVVALDREEPVALWKLSSDAVSPTLWNNDWDSSSLVIDDHLIIGGENGRFFVVELRRGFDADGLVTVDPVIAYSTESWDAELLTALGDLQVSVENSVAVSGDVAWFTNSGGLVQGWDIGDLAEGGEPFQVFRYWTGDDTDASLVIDEEGMIYLGSEYERGTARSQELGQIMKLDPSRPDDPVVWSREANEGLGSGIWATPALWGNLLIVATNGGELLGLDRETGEERWTLELPGPLWSSPVVVDDVLIQTDCEGGINAFDLSGGGRPTELWSIQVGGCLESTPAVWDGWIYVGSRDGRFYAVSDCEAIPGRPCGVDAN